MQHLIVWVIVGIMIFCRWVKFFDGGGAPDQLDSILVIVDIVLWCGGGLMIFYLVSRLQETCAAIAEFNKLHEDIERHKVCNRISMFYSEAAEELDKKMIELEEVLNAWEPNKDWDDEDEDEDLDLEELWGVI